MLPRASIPAARCGVRWGMEPGLPRGPDLGPASAPASLVTARSRGGVAFLPIQGQ